jgi:hypothetical protein
MMTIIVMITQMIVSKFAFLQERGEFLALNNRLIFYKIIMIVIKNMYDNKIMFNGNKNYVFFWKRHIVLKILTTYSAFLK